MFIALSSPFIQKFSNRQAPFVWLFVFVLFCIVFFFFLWDKSYSDGGGPDDQMARTSHFDPKEFHFFRLGS